MSSSLSEQEKMAVEVLVEKVEGLGAEAGIKEKDHIKRINEVPIQSLENFENLIKGQQKIVLYISRGSKINRNKVEFAKKKRLLPPNIEKIIKRHAGYDYIIVNVRYDSSAGRPFGLNIANVTAHKIIIPEVAENTVAGDYLKIYDHIIAINGNPVSDVTVAKKMIRECGANFQKNGKKEWLVQQTLNKCHQMFRKLLRNISNNANSSKPPVSFRSFVNQLANNVKFISQNTILRRRSKVIHPQQNVYAHVGEKR
uniref:PDZ domain-containing protein n=1 Tax=Wuchereria bancrofti TaxID=6293 RepID=A0AAF5PM10_WUCBA